MSQVFMTHEAKKQLEERLKMLKSQGRADIAEKIRQARDFGDISENAEYDIAKDEQAKLEAEIADIEDKLRNATLIDDRVKTDVVNMGTTVRLYDSYADCEVEYKLVGSHESNPIEGRISNECAVGKALLGHRKGEIVRVETPMGVMEYKILKIS